LNRPISPVWTDEPVTIITPAWNARDYLVETVLSVVSQIQAGDEYIVVDDGSTDGSAEILDQLAHCHNFILIRQENTGEIEAVNTAMARAKHDLICIVNADDPILPGLVTTMRNVFASDPELAAAYPDWRKIDGDGREISTVEAAEYEYTVMLAQHFCIPGPGAFFRRRVISGAPVRDPAAYGVSDYDFWLRFGRAGARIQRVPRVLATWRLHAESTTFSANGTSLATAKIAVVERFFARMDLDPCLRALNRQALSAAFYHAALLGLRMKGVPAWRYAVRSFAILPIWPKTVLKTQRRSRRHLLYAVAQPLSGALHRLIDPLLPARYRHARVLTQTFGLDV